jgi:hypothetical protein
MPRDSTGASGSGLTISCSIRQVGPSATLPLEYKTLKKLTGDEHSSLLCLTHKTKTEEDLVNILNIFFSDQQLYFLHGPILKNFLRQYCKLVRLSLQAISTLVYYLRGSIRGEPTRVGSSLARKYLTRV